MQIGMTELILIFIVALFALGPDRLDCQYCLQAPWAISLMASTTKSGYINSTMGRRPIQAKFMDS